MNMLRCLIIAGILALALAGPGWALVVVDDPFESYLEGSYLAGQGNWTGPFFQGGDPHDSNGPMIVTSPVSGDAKAARWQMMMGNDVHAVTVTNTFPAEWTSGKAVMYIDVAMDATNGTGNFSYFQIFDSLGNEATRIYLRRYAGTTGDIHLLGRTGSTGGALWLPNVVVNPANNTYYKLKLDIDITNKKYSAYLGDGDRSGVNVGHWGHYDGSGVLQKDGVAAAQNMYFYYPATGLASVTWLMYRIGSNFTGPAYAFCDNLYIEGPDNAVGVRNYEIWVAKGTYTEKVSLRPFSHLYGGFAGTEASKLERNGAANPTIIDAGNTAPGNSAVTGASVTSVDGFTIRGGYYGVDASIGGPTIANNVITGNAQAGVNCSGASPLVANNTIINSAGTGVTCGSGSPQLLNNIIAYNSVGISATGGSSMLSHNNLYGNTTAYSGVQAGSGDISTDSAFVNQASGDYHLLLGSPCIDAGDSSAAVISDRDGGLRPVDGNGDGFADMDIGAYESQFVPAYRDLPELKLQADENMSRFEDAIVSAAWPDHFYVESDDRVVGIRVDKPGHGLAVSQRANVSGTIRTDANGERYISALAAIPHGAGSVGTLGLPVRAIGGSGLSYDPVTGEGQQGTTAYFSPGNLAEASGLNNIGLLIRTWGRVTWSDGDTFYVDDGSGCYDADPDVRGVRVLMPSGTTAPSTDAYVRVTGVSSCYKVGDNLYRLIKVRAEADVAPLQ